MIKVVVHDYLEHIKRNEKPRIKENQQTLRDMPLDPLDFEELRDFNRQELEALMDICCIKVYNELPVVALTDNEMRMAYMAWKGHHYEHAMKDWRSLARRLSKVLDVVKRYTERGFL